MFKLILLSFLTEETPPIAMFSHINLSTEEECEGAAQVFVDQITGPMSMAAGQQILVQYACTFEGV